MIHSENSPRPAAAIVTVSDSCARGVRQDLSGPAIARALDEAGFEPVAQITVPDDRATIEDTLRRAASAARLVVTTGGTGIATRDVTPEATRAVCDRLLDGIPELMRAAGLTDTPLAALSRALCGTLGSSIILNVPGSPSGALASLQAALPVLPHALDLLEGNTEHPAKSSPRPPAKKAAKKTTAKPAKKTSGQPKAARPLKKSKSTRHPSPALRKG